MSMQQFVAFAMSLHLGRRDGVPLHPDRVAIVHREEDAQPSPKLNSAPMRCPLLDPHARGDLVDPNPRVPGDREEDVGMVR